LIILFNYYFSPLHVSAMGIFFYLPELVAFSQENQYIQKVDNQIIVKMFGNDYASPANCISSFHLKRNCPS